MLYDIMSLLFTFANNALVTSQFTSHGPDIVPLLFSLKINAPQYHVFALHLETCKHTIIELSLYAIKFSIYTKTRESVTFCLDLIKIIRKRFAI